MSRLSTILLFVLLFAVTIPPMPASATALLAPKKDEAAAEETAPPIDQWGRSTPRGLVEGFLTAIAQDDLKKAALYLDTEGMGERKAQEQAQTLRQLLDKGGWFYPSGMLSNAREGKKDGEEGEEDTTDIIGSLRGNDKTVDIVATIKTQSDEQKFWLISKETLGQMASLIDGAEVTAEPRVNTVLPDALVERKWAGAPAGHWIATLVLLVASYGAVWFILLGITGLLKKFWTRRNTINGVPIVDIVRVPLSLYLAVWAFGFSSLWAGISIIVRQNFGQLNIIVAWAAIALLAWRLIDVFAEATQRRIGSNGRFYGFSSVLYFFRRMIKIVFGVILLFIVLDNLGVDVTAGLAALGIGGIALALGAQKTLENFIGSLAIIIDQPIHIGDYCKIGDVAGTVEDIGMRSTRLRTNDRTLVTIPNGDLSNQTIENFARRARYLVNRKFQLRYDAPAHKIGEFVERLQKILFDSEFVPNEGLPVRYIGPGEGGQVIELFFYINIADYNEFLKEQQRIMIALTALVDEMELFFIIPSQTMLPAVDQRGAEAGTHAAPVYYSETAAT